MTEPVQIGDATLYCGDMLEVVPTLGPVDSIVTDPPYHLTSIVQRLGKPGSAPIQEGTDGAYARASKGFMGKTWDGGDIAFRPETWRLVFGVLKPGGHLLAFGGTRNSHRMVCAIEDAGFEIRDTLFWLYGSGFPKSHDVSKGIDKAAGHWRGRAGETTRAGESFGQEYERASKGDPVTAAAAWEGWGTALKPACEPIVLARKPLIGTVATNVLGHGTGALNIDGCRVGTNDTYAYPSGPGGCKAGEFHYQGRADTPAQSHPKGRWPANVVHDGSDEVLEAFARFGESKSQRATLTSKPGDIYGGGAGLPSHTGEYGANDFGTAARFFYSAKADATDRLGSKHPTVKPVDLMRWLVRLVTPPGGTVLDPFAGTGTTGMAALAEGMKAILIEREAEYFEDIKLRMGHVSGADTPLFAEPCDGEGGA